MNLQLLHSAPHIDIHFDSYNDWLYVNWSGDLTLPLVKAGCAYVGQCFLSHPYPRVLNDNTHVTSISWNTAPWLISDFMPHLRLVGVQQMAWVRSPSLPGLSMVQTVVSWLPHLAIAVFDDVEDGSDWLQRGRRTAGAMYDYPYPARSAATQQRIATIAADLTRQAGLTHLFAPTDEEKRKPHEVTKVIK